MRQIVPPEGGSHEHLFFDGNGYFKALIEGIDQARKFVDFEVYIFELGVTGHRVLKALERAARRGVRVRLLVDGFGSRAAAERLAERLGPSSIQFRVYRPIRWTGLLPAKANLRALSRRNHRKTCRIDDHFAWIGSFNVSDVHTRRGAGSRPWRDSAVRIRGAGFPGLGAAFERAWSGKPHRSRTRGEPASRPLLLNCTARLRKERNRLLVRRIRGAKRRVWVTTPYFTPDHLVLRALKAAAAAGVDVRLLVPEAPDVPGMGWVNSSFYKLLFRSGLKIYLYRSSVLHAKTVLADDWAIVGSSNLNHRSLFNDLEIDAVLTSLHSRLELERQFRLDLRASRELKQHDPRGDSAVTHALDRLAFWLRSWT